MVYKVDRELVWTSSESELVQKCLADERAKRVLASFHTDVRESCSSTFLFKGGLISLRKINRVVDKSKAIHFVAHGRGWVQGEGQPPQLDNH